MTRGSMPPTKLPTELQAVDFDPELSRALEGLLEPYSGKALERAQAAVLKVRASDRVGSFGEIVETYQRAIEAATARVSA